MMRAEVVRTGNAGLSECAGGWRAGFGRVFAR